MRGGVVAELVCTFVYLVDKLDFIIRNPLNCLINYTRLPLKHTGRKFLQHFDSTLYLWIMQLLLGVSWFLLGSTTSWFMFRAIHLIVKTCLKFFSVVRGCLTAHNLSSAKRGHLKTCNGHLHFYFSHNTQQVSQEKI